MYGGMFAKPLFASIHYRFNPNKYKEMKSKGFRLEFWL